MKMETERQAFKKVRDIPGPMSIPFFGTTLSPSGFGGKDLMRANEDQVQKFGSIVKQEHYWNYPIIQVFDPNDIDEVMKADKNGSIRPPMEILTTYRKLRKDRYASSGIANEEGEHWNTLHSKLTLLSTKSIAGYLPNLNATADDFMSMMRAEGPEINNFGDMTMRVVAENSFQLTLGQRVGFLTGEDNENVQTFLNTHKKYWAALHNSCYGFPFWKLYPNKIWRDFVTTEDSMYQISIELAEEAAKSYEQEGLFSSFLKATDLDNKDKITSVMDFINAAIEPVVNSLNLIIYGIAKFEEVQKKLQTELREVLPSKDSPIDNQTLKKLPYLVACIKEGFRYNPTTPNTARVLENDIHLQGYTIPAYTMLICQSWYNCMQDKNFYRASEFIPERWLHDIGSLEAEQYLPHRQSMCRHFGFGRRMCPGRRYAFQEVCVLIAKIFRNFRMEFPNGLEYNYEFLITPVEPICVKFYELED